MSDPTKPLYTPALGSQAAIGMAHIRSMHPAPVSGGDLAELLGCDSKNVFAAMRRCVEYGLMQVSKIGVRNMYQLTEREARNGRDTSDVTPEQLQAYAKRAVIQLRGQTKSSVDLAAWCDTTPSIIDKALAPLSEEGKLCRVDVFRSGQQMFDYRWGATYVPHDVDFAGPVASCVPVPSVQPVADKITEKPRKPASSPTNPNSPWRKEGMQLPGSPDLKRSDALATGGELGKKEAAPAHPIKVPDFKQQDAQAMLGWQIEKVSSGRKPELEAEEGDGVEFCITNKGTLYIDSVAGEVTQLSFREALALKRFLDNTSILEDLAAGGAL